jgi:RNA-binding protein YhbY
MNFMNESDARLKVLEKITAVLIDLVAEEADITDEDREAMESITDEIAEDLDLTVVSVDGSTVTLTVKVG